MSQSKIRPYLHLIKRELFFLFKADKRRAVFLILAASAYLIFFSILYQQGSVTEIPTIVLDQNNSALSRKIVQCIDDSDTFHVVDMPLNLEEFQHKMSHGKELAGFIIPTDFNKEAESGRSTQILLVVEGSNLLITSSSSIGAMEILQTFSKEKGIHLLEKNVSLASLEATQKVEPVSFSYRVLGNQTRNYMYYLVLGLFLAAFQQGLFIGIGASFLYKFQGIAAKELELNWLMRYVAKISPYLILGICGYGLAIFLSYFVFHFPFNNALYEMLTLGAAFAFAIINIGGVIANLVRNELTYNRICIAYVVPAFILSGCTWPVEGMVKPIQKLSSLSPLTYMATTFRELFLNGHSSHWQQNTFILCFIGLAAFFFAAYLYNRRIKMIVAQI